MVEFFHDTYQALLCQCCGTLESLERLCQLVRHHDDEDSAAIRECRDLGRAMLQQSRVLEALMRADPLIGAHLSVTLTACIKHVRRMCAWECRANPDLSPTPDYTQAHSSW